MVKWIEVNHRPLVETGLMMNKTMSIEEIRVLGTGVVQVRVETDETFLMC